MVKPVSDRIEELEKLGFKRWTKGNYDRMYINAYKLGLEILEWTKSRTMAKAAFCGEVISNRLAGKYIWAKTYIDLKTGEVHSDYPELAERAKEIAGI